MTLEEASISEKLQVSHLYAFECVVYFHVPNEKRTNIECLKISWRIKQLK